MPREKPVTTNASDCGDELVLASRDAFPTASPAESSKPRTTPSTPPSAKLGLDRFRDAASGKGLAAALDNLPSLAAVTVERQSQFPSEHPFKVCIGFLDNCPVWAALGKNCSVGSSHAAAIMFYTGHTDIELVSSGLFAGLGKVDMVDPFKSFWEKTAHRIDNVVDSIQLKGRWDERRGQFKSLVYWYFVNESAERDGVCYVPNSILKYFVSALKILNKTAPTKNQSIGVIMTRESSPVEDTSATQSTFAECRIDKRIEKVIQEELKQREMKEMRQTVEARKKQEKEAGSAKSNQECEEMEALKMQFEARQGQERRKISSSKETSCENWDLNKLSSRTGKANSTENGDAKRHTHNGKRTIDCTDTESYDNTPTSEIHYPSLKHRKTTDYSPKHHIKDYTTDDSTAPDMKQNFKRASTELEELFEQEKSLQDQAKDLEKRYAEVLQQQAIVQKLKEEKQRVIKGLVEEWDV